MFGLSRSTEYAVMALARLAAAQDEAGQDDTAGCAISAQALARADGSPAALVSSVLKRLHHAGLVRSRRGAKGGYYLARPPERVPLAEVIAAVEGAEPVRLTPCCEPESGEPQDRHDGCRIVCHCPISGAIRRLNRRMNRFLDELSLADLLGEA